MASVAVIKTGEMSSISAGPSISSSQPNGNGNAYPKPLIKPQRRKRFVTMTDIGLTIPMLKTMLKGALPPTIAIAIYQSDRVAERYGTLGTQIAIVSILSLCTLPRMKFLQTLFLNILGTCLACAMSFLGLVLSIRARSHSEAQPSTDYNSSASVVCAIFLFANIYGINTMRARFPALQFPAITYSINIAVSFTDMPTFNMSRGSAFIWRMAEAYLTGYAIAAGVSLLIFPLSGREIMIRQFTTTINSLRQAIHPRLVEKKEREHETQAEEKYTDANTTVEKGINLEFNQAIARSINLCQSFSKLLVDVTAGKLEIGWGKLEPADVDELVRLMRAVLVPAMGLSLRGEIFQDISEPNLVLLREISEMGYFMNAAYDHITVKLGLAPPLRTPIPGDMEAAKLDDAIGKPYFEENFRDLVGRFCAARERRIKTWTTEKTDDLEIRKEMTETSMTSKERFVQQQLYILLYIEHLMESCATSALNLIKFVDLKSQIKGHLILPASLLQGHWHHFKHASEDPEHSVARSERRPQQANNSTEGYFNPIDMEIEHLPPETSWERHSDHFRTIAHILRSPESVFGLRVTLATLSIGITAYLEESQLFFQRNRLVWALVISTIGMSWTSGQSVFGLLVRVLGTLIASILSFVIWYVVDGKTGGVIFMLFLFTFFEFYFVIKYPKYIVVSVIAMVTQVVIVGYDLQVRKIGKPAAEASGQPFYPVYVLAPYRLACIAGGCLVAFIWTIFPYPITARSQLRKDLGASIYMLAKYYACVHAGVVARYQGTEGDLSSPNSLGSLLAQNESRISAEEMGLLGTLAGQAEFTMWELKTGGRFPRKRFENVIHGTQSLMQNLALMAHITKTLPKDSLSPWFRKLARLLKEINPTSHDVVTTLILLSASVTNGNALPPYLQAPANFDVSRRLMALDSEILSMKHISEEGYAPYAALQVTITLVSADLENLIENVKELVGEVNFRFNVSEEDTMV